MRRNERGNQVARSPRPAYLSPMPSITLAPRITLVPGYLDRRTQDALLAAIRAVIAAAQRAAEGGKVATRERGRLYRRTYAGEVAFGSSSLSARRTRSASRSASRILLYGDPCSKKITVSQPGHSLE
jgi:hypothetical protein